MFGKNSKAAADAKAAAMIYNIERDKDKKAAKDAEKYQDKKDGKK